jgi:hypothetical protein
MFIALEGAHEDEVRSNNIEYVRRITTEYR